MTVEFERDTQTASFHSPLEEFEQVSVEVEVRTDPLTGRQARIVPESFLLPDEEPDIASVVEDDEGCFFCPGMVEEATPEYPDWMGFDRGSRGEATSFPNLNPYGAYSNVVALTEDHYRPIDGFGADVFEDGLAAALQYVRAVVDHDDDARFASVNMNFLRPAGSSIVHPHLQTLVDDRATNEARARMAAAREFRDEHGEPYWTALVDAERGGERYVGTTGSVEWLAPFAPKHHYHVQGVADEPGVPDPDGDVVAGLAAGIDSTLAYYGDLGLNSFNFALHLAADDGWRPVIDLIGRSVFDEYYWSDSPFFAALHDEGVVDVAPESVASDAAEWF
jgi:galactose-1-phosphate uridylyltransferase